MIYELAITPGVFDANTLADVDVARDLVRILDGLLSNGLVADFAGEQVRVEIGRHVHALPDGRIKEELIELLTILDNRQRFVPRDYIGPGWPSEDVEWYDEALATAALEPVHGIVSTRSALAARRARIDHVAVGDVCISDMWRNRQRTRAILRNAPEFVAALRPLLVSARSLKIIDPYIARIPDVRYVDTLLALFRAAATRTTGHRLRVLEVYTSTGGSSPASWDTWKGNFEAEFRRTFGVFGSPELSIDVFVWEKRDDGPDLHNRFIISNALGVQLGFGIDASSVQTEEDDWCVMDERHRERVALRYGRASKMFIPVHQFSVR